MNKQVAALTIADLRIRYGDREVLRGLSLSVAAGEIYGLLGPNGAGKTTLIRTICGRLRPVAGTVTVAGFPSGWEALRNIGLVPQEIALYPHLTVEENLKVFGRLSGLTSTATNAAIAWASEAANLTDRMSDRIDILSGGWKRRVNIAAGMLHRPALLILDEPTVGVDIDARHSLQEIIQKLSQRGIAVLLATHDLDQAESICTTVGFLRNGVVTPQGPPRALIDSTFAGQHEIILELRHVPSPSQVVTLGEAGFSASSNGLTWSMLGSPSDGSAAELSFALDKAGIATQEVRLRKPGLDSLFVRLSRTPELEIAQ